MPSVYSFSNCLSSFEALAVLYELLWRQKKDAKLALGFPEQAKSKGSCSQFFHQGISSETVSLVPRLVYTCLHMA